MLCTAASNEKRLKFALGAQAEDLKEAFTRDLTNKAEAIRAEVQDDMAHHIAVIREQHVKELVAMQQQLTALHGELAAFAAVAESTDVASQSSVHQHKNSAALLALEGALTSSKPFSTELAAVRAAATKEADALALAVVATIPAGTPAAGVPTFQELRARFAVVRGEARKAAYAPDQAPTIMGQVIGSALAAVAPAPKGYVAGTGVDETLARAAFFLDRGNLSAAVKEVSGLQGYPRVLVNDWQTAAAARLVVDQAATTLRTSAVLRHGAY